MTLQPNIQSITFKDRERRYKGVLIDPQHIVFTTMGARKAEYLSLMYEDIPQDAKVVDVTYDWSYRAFAMTLWHESFDIVPYGQQIPMHFPLKVNVVRHLCCQPVELKHPNLPNGHNELFNQFIRDHRFLLEFSMDREAKEKELDSWIKEYKKTYGVHHEQV